MYFPNFGPNRWFRFEIWSNVEKFRTFSVFRFFCGRRNTPLKRNFELKICYKYHLNGPKGINSSFTLTILWAETVLSQLFYFEQFYAILKKFYNLKFVQTKFGPTGTKIQCFLNCNTTVVVRNRETFFRNRINWMRLLFGDFWTSC